MLQKCSIPIEGLFTSANNPALKSQRGQASLSESAKLHIAQKPATCAIWGFPLDHINMRYPLKNGF